jgi:hypothetical protein
LQAGLYLRGSSPKTAITYGRAFDSFQRTPGSELSKARLAQWIVSCRQAGRLPAGINVHIRAVNTFGTWLKEEGHVEKPIVLEQLRVPQKQLVIFSDLQMRPILTFKPKRVALSARRTCRQPSHVGGILPELSSDGSVTARSTSNPT